MPNGSLPKKLACALGSYVRDHPEELLRAAKNTASLKVGVPVKGLLWLAQELGGDKVPQDLFLEARTPGVYVRASFEMMKTPLLGGANVIIQRVDLRDDALIVDVRLEDISLEVTRQDVGTPVAALLQSGALDLSRPGDLLSYMPKRPAVLVEAKGNVLTLDLMKHPKLSAERARRLISLLIGMVGVEAIETDNDHLDISFKALPAGAGGVLEKLKALF